MCLPLRSKLKCFVFCCRTVAGTDIKAGGIFCSLETQRIRVCFFTKPASNLIYWVDSRPVDLPHPDLSYRSGRSQISSVEY